MSEAKQLWVLTGGNGAGKSTFFRLCLEPRGMAFINADQIARDIDPEHPEQASYEAARLAALLRDSLLREGRSFCYETVFSHPSKIDFVAQAKALGYEVILVFVHLDNPQLNCARVAQRVSEGGHNVPDEKIRSRLQRTLRNVRVGLSLADEVYLLDNSRQDNPLRPVAQMRSGQVKWAETPPRDWAREMLQDYI